MPNTRMTAVGGVSGVSGLAIGALVAASVVGTGSPPTIDVGLSCPDTASNQGQVVPIDVSAPEPTINEALWALHGAFAPLSIPQEYPTEDTPTDSGEVNLPIPGILVPSSGRMTVDVAEDGRLATDATGTGGVAILVGATPGRHTYSVQSWKDCGPLSPKLAEGEYRVLKEIF